MERSTRSIRSLKLLWRSERMLAEQQLKIATGRLVLVAVSALVGLFGLGTLDFAAFFAIEPHWGAAGAALTVGLVNLALAAAVIVYAGTLKPGPELEMVKETRDMALDDLEGEAAMVEAELRELHGRALRLVENPVEALLPAVVRPFAGSLAKRIGQGGGRSSRKK